jgi:hypothetical protein
VTDARRHRDCRRHAANRLDVQRIFFDSAPAWFGYLDFSFSGSGLIGGSRLADDLVQNLTTCGSTSCRCALARRHRSRDRP